LAGFFATVKAIRSASDDLLNAGKEFASKFKSGELSPDDYESTMIGKIHEIVNANSKGDTDLEKYLEKTFASGAIESLKVGVKSYKDSMVQTNVMNEEDSNSELDSSIEKAKTIKDLLTDQH